jgi:hypothetical protein
MSLAIRECESALFYAPLFGTFRILFMLSGFTYRADSLLNSTTLLTRQLNPYIKKEAQMNNLITPAIFYVIITIYIISLQRNKGLEILFSPLVDTFKYLIGTVAFFFININVLFFCSFCGHCHDACIAFIMSAVLVGAAVYLTHLGRQTITAVKQIMAGKEVDLMAPFFSIPYFVLIYDIIDAVLNSGLSSLHAYEGKMLIVLLYPCFIVLGELTARIKAIKDSSQ